MQNCWNLRFCLLRILTCKYMAYQIALYLVRVVKLNSMLCCRMFINNISHEMLIHKKGYDNSLRPAVILCLSKQCLKLASCGEPKISVTQQNQYQHCWLVLSSGLIRDTFDPNGTLIAYQSYIDSQVQRLLYLSVALHKITNKS